MTRRPGRPPKRPGPALAPPQVTRFVVGRHEVRIWVDGDRWTATVDGALLPRWFPTQVEAWTAAVAEADLADHRAAS